MKKQSLKHLSFTISAILGFTISQAQTQESLVLAIDTALLDKKIKSSEDFVGYVNGIWLAKTEIPADRSSWGSFHELLKKTDANSLAILKKASKDFDYKSNTDQAKAVNLFDAVLDTVGRNKKGILPLKPYLGKINAIKNVKDLENLLIEMEPVGGIGFFNVYVSGDEKNSTKKSVNLASAALGLPDKDYYLSEDKDSKEKREKYLLHVARMLQFIGEDPAIASQNAKKILALEIEMSKSRLNRAESRDRILQYNPTSIIDLQKNMPSINWKKYFTDIGMANVDTIIVEQPRYMQALEKIFKKNNILAWKEYLKWALLNSSTSQLSVEIENADFDFYGKILTGAIKQRPREEKALNVVNNYIGEALGKLYVEKFFPYEAKVKAEKMIQNVILAYQNRINNLTWMSSETKAKAIYKLKKITIKIGYPDKWKDYSALQIKNITEGGTYFDDLKSLAKWKFDKEILDLGKPVDKTVWGMSPQTVNAYYNPSYNEIVFPAAILQPPFYNYQADEAVNYGGIGAVIGHEISHGFDDTGARYNAEGNLIDWWKPEELEQFTTLGSALANQYSALEPIPGIHVDGKFTLGENIGDLGGVNAAYDGLQLYLKENGNPGLIDGFTPEQRFFISWAIIWRIKMRDEALKNQVKVDTHTPGMYRAYVPLQNIDAFYDAFSIKEGDKMYIEPRKRVKIW